MLVLAFVCTGAILRQINPLFILSGLMMAPFLINWRFAMAMLRWTEIRRVLPKQVSAGQPFSVELIVSNRSSRFDCWNVGFIDSLESVSNESGRFATSVEVPFSHVPAMGETNLSYKCQLNCRGLYSFGPLVAKTRFPLGLVRAAQTHVVIDPLVVGPRIGTLTPSWHQALQSPLRGSGANVGQRGLSEGDFYAIRHWRSGDSRRWIHWRTSAKLGELAIRQYEQKIDHNLLAILDLWQPFQPTQEDFDAVELAASFAATIVASATATATAEVTLAIGDRFGEILRASQPGDLFERAMNRLAVASATSEPRTLDAFLGAFSSIAPTTAVFVISSRERPAQWTTQGKSDVNDQDRMMHQLKWINVRDPQVGSWFNLS